MFQALGLALGLSILFVYMILASQFGSFVHPLTIMLALPFSVVGALLALFAGHFNFDMLAMIGMILLMGLVTKNSILLVDFANQLRERGMDRLTAISESARTRFRPIVMTTVAMIFGMLPLALGLDPAVESRSSLGVVVIGGLISSLLLTLVLIPVIYARLSPKQMKVKEERVAAALRAVDADEGERGTTGAAR
jgi:HAE1 family hydrophobic/amphiphilic exporter-1